MNIVTKVCRRRDTADSARQRRDALIETAERIFLRKGYHATTMDDIAAEAGMSKRTLYQLVESKEDLFTALLERRRRPLDVSGIETEGRAVEDVLNDMIRLWAHHVMSPSIIALARLIMAEYMHGRTLSRLLDREGAKPCRDACATISWPAMHAAISPSTIPRRPRTCSTAWRSETSTSKCCSASARRAPARKSTPASPAR
ncbi:unnamed protein product [Acidocella sp. C78]|nr:unnamed protein product [Acidocella sp. C78]